MSSMSNKARTFEILVEIREILELLLMGRNPDMRRLDKLLAAMQQSVNTTEGTNYDSLR